MARRRLVAGLLALALPFVSAAECKRRTQPEVQTTRAPEDRQVDPATARDIEISVLCGEACSILIIATDARGAEERIGPVSWLASRGGFVDSVTYTSGQYVRVEVRVTPGKRGDTVRISIADGRWNRAFARNDLDDGSVRIGPLTAMLESKR